MLGNRHVRGVLQAVAAVALAGCTTNTDTQVPIECLQGPKAIRAALGHAPSQVRLEGRVRISDCFSGAAPSSDVETLGGNLIAVTDQLGRRVRAAPHSHSAIELGYLMGAVRAGSGGSTGVHYEAARRIEQELTGVPTDTPEYRRGLDAGRRTG